MIRIVCCIACFVFFVPIANAHCRRITRPQPAIAYYRMVCGYGPAIWGAPAQVRVPPAAVTEESDPARPKPTAEPARLTKPAEAKPPATAPKTLPEPKPARSLDGPKKEPESLRKVDQFLVPSEGKKSEVAKEVKVGFFNHTGRDLILEIHGETVDLPSSQYVTLRLPRSFRWSEKRGKANEVTIPDDADGIDVSWLDGIETVGVTSGASAPERLVIGVCDWFRERGVTRFEPFRIVEEDVTFRLPVELRRELTLAESQS